MTTQLTIASTAIRQDQAGRFCLNDLHRAAGAEPHHQPGKFIFNKGTAELIEALQANSPDSEISLKPVAAERGRYGGTYVVKELVYAYAMWISPRFHLQVIRAYDALATQPAPQQTALKAPGTLREALTL